jgi:hypothetical protein
MWARAAMAALMIGFTSLIVFVPARARAESPCRQVSTVVGGQVRAEARMPSFSDRFVRNAANYEINRFFVHNLVTQDLRRDWMILVGTNIKRHAECSRRINDGSANMGYSFTNLFSRKRVILPSINVIPCVWWLRNVSNETHSSPMFHIFGWLFANIQEKHFSLQRLVGIGIQRYTGRSYPSATARLSVVNQIFGSIPKPKGGEKQTCGENRYECRKSVWWAAPPTKPTLKKFGFILGGLLSLAAPIFLMFGRHSRPWIGLPLYILGLAMIVSAAAL